jgi:hypothetical protein
MGAELGSQDPALAKTLLTRAGAARLKGHVYPIIGETRVRDVELADIERVMALLTGNRLTQRKLSALTRSTIALTVNRLFNIAVYSLKIISASPIPKASSQRRASAARWLTGHRSSQMLARYRRPARTAADVGLGDWTPLDVALGLTKRELRSPADRRARAGAHPLAWDSEWDRVAPPIRFERTTLALGKPCSVQLSYGGGSGRGA